MGGGQVMFTEVSRFILFGADTMARKPTLTSVLWGTGQNAARRLFGLEPTRSHTLIDYGTYYAQLWAARWFGKGPVALPNGWPSNVFNTLDRLVKARGGSQTVGDGVQVPCFSLDRKSALVLPHMWLVYLNVHGDACDIRKLLRLEEDFEDALARECKMKLNLRILTKPLRIEIDKLAPTTGTLSQQWEMLKRTGKPNWYLSGDFWDGDEMQTGWMDLASSNEFSAFFVGGSGSGKTQLMLGSLLTIAYHTSPDDLSIVVVDPKALDFPVSRLPHLAGAIITDPHEATEAILRVVAEMDRRVHSSDRKASSKRILIVIDELADLLSVQKGSELEVGLQRLAQKGRAWGFSLWIGSQRPTKDSMPQSVLQNVPCRFVGRVGSATEAALASGKDGCDAHRLPGRGAFQIYCPGVEDGLRIQGLFVADANKPDYEKRIAGFVDDIRQRWDGKVPHWTLCVRPDNDDDDDGSAETRTTVGPDTDAMQSAAEVLAELDDNLLAQLWQRFTDGELSQRAIDAMYREHYGKGASWGRYKRIRDALTVGHATIFAENC